MNCSSKSIEGVRSINPGVSYSSLPRVQLLEDSINSFGANYRVGYISCVYKIEYLLCIHSFIPFLVILSQSMKFSQFYLDFLVFFQKTSKR